MRDEFPERIKRIIAERAGHRCSYPSCRAATYGPQENSAGSINIGIAAHICAASPGGPRFDSAMSAEQRVHPDNGIWLCQTHAKLVDNDPQHYPVAELLRWKKEAEGMASLLVGRSQVDLTPSDRELTAEEQELICWAHKGGGHILLLCPDYPADWVRAGPKDFLDMADPSVGARYCDALRRLVGRSLVRNDEGDHYMLTGVGFQVAEQLCPKTP